MPFKRYLTHFKYFDWLTLVLILILISFGLAALYSIALSQDSPDFLNFKKQLVFTGLGILLLFIFSFLDYNLLKAYSYPIYIISVISLVAVLILGISLRGTRGWFSISGFTFQPVEIAKLALIIFLAKFFSQQAQRKFEIKFLLVSGAIFGILFILTILQPDFGSALLLFLIWFLMLLILGIKKTHLLILLTLIILSSIFAWTFLFKDYQKDRILTFFNPESDPYGRGYHVRQAVIAVGAGKFFGRGLGFGSQTQLKFIPASGTDFIFAVIAEELGFFSVALILAFFTVLFYRLIRIAKNASDDFALFLVLGIIILFFSQLFINVGMNIGLVPVTGISLPFLSYGGSFLITSLIMIGIVESVAIKSVMYKA